MARHELPAARGLSVPDMAGAAARTYRKARKAYHASAAPDAPGDVFHRLRRHARYHAIHMQMLRDAGPELLEDRTARLDELAHLLGEEHDLGVLCEAVEQAPPALPASAVAGIVRVARARQATLRARALDLAGALFAERPSAIEARIAAYCRARRPA